jgi:taurine dehydrogenase small subunit
MTHERLQKFADAWNQKDADLLLGYMTSDCVSTETGGPPPFGTISEGAEAVRATFAGVFAAFPDVRFDTHYVFVAGSLGARRWSFKAHDANGAPVEVEGCDLFEFDGDKIKRKDSFRKPT